MSYWRRPKFWIILAIAEVAAAALSALIATAVGFAFQAADSWTLPTVAKWVGPIVNLYLAYDAFRFARAAATDGRQPRGFPVLLLADKPCKSDKPSTGSAVRGTTE